MGQIYAINMGSGLPLQHCEIHMKRITKEESSNTKTDCCILWPQPTSTSSQDALTEITHVAKFLKGLPTQWVDPRDNIRITYLKHAMLHPNSHPHRTESKNATRTRHQQNQRNSHSHSHLTRRNFLYASVVVKIWGMVQGDMANVKFQ